MAAVTRSPDSRAASDEGSASLRWRRLVSARIDEMQRLSPGLGALDGSFWNPRAERYATNVKLADSGDDPFLRRLRRATDAGSTAVDVGAGTGRYALALAPSVAHVTAVDPSEAMLAILRREARRLSVRNLTAVTATWDDAEVEPADVAFSAFVLPLVPNGRSFVSKLDAVARRHAFLYLGAYSGDAVIDPLWRHFHGAPRAPGASYLDALAMLRELGIDPDIKVVDIPNRRRFATVDDAVDHYAEALLLDDDPDVRGELRGLLEHWLMGRRGAYRSPLRSVNAAIMRWSPRKQP